MVYNFVQLMIRSSVDEYNQNVRMIIAFYTFVYSTAAWNSSENTNVD